VVAGFSDGPALNSLCHSRLNTAAGITEDEYEDIAKVVGQGR